MVSHRASLASVSPGWSPWLGGMRLGRAGVHLSVKYDTPHWHWGAGFPGAFVALLPGHWEPPELLLGLWLPRLSGRSKRTLCHFQSGLGAAGRCREPRAKSSRSGGASWMPGKGPLQ